MKYKLTDPYIRGFETDKRLEIFDTIKSGLALRVSPSGYKSFFFRYRYKGKNRRFTIGNYPSVSLRKAREKADELRVEVQKGGDPQGELQKKKKEAIPKTISELAEIFEKEYVNKKLKPSTQKTYMSRVRKIVSAFGDFTLDELSRSEVKFYLKRLAEKQSYNANRVQAIFSKMYSFAVEEEFTSNHPLRNLSKFGDEEVREVNYYADDIRQIWNIIEEANEPSRSLYKVLLMTGQRLGETSRMKWEDIDTVNALWIIPRDETKGGRTHVVPLTRMVSEVLEKLHVITGDKTYVFSSPNLDDSYFNSVGTLVDKIREEKNLEDFRTHDLRRIVATNMQRLSIDFMHIGKVLNHKGMAREYTVTSRYIDYDYLEEKKAALQRWHTELQRIIEGETAAVFKIGRV
jgi:integrase